MRTRPVHVKDCVCDKKGRDPDCYRSEPLSLEEQCFDARDEIKKLRARLALTKEALRAFTNTYPNRAWEGLLHEEGCVGVRERKSDREPGWPCACDGDYRTTLIKKALR